MVKNLGRVDCEHGQLGRMQIWYHVSKGPACLMALFLFNPKFDVSFELPSPVVRCALSVER